MRAVNSKYDFFQHLEGNLFIVINGVVRYHWRVLETTVFGRTGGNVNVSYRSGGAKLNQINTELILQ